MPRLPLNMNSNRSDSQQGWWKNFKPQKEKIMAIQRRKRQTVKKIHNDKNESIIRYSKEKYLKNGTPRITYQKVNYQENPEAKLPYANRKWIIRKILKQNCHMENVNTNVKQSKNIIVKWSTNQILKLEKEEPWKSRTSQKLKKLGISNVKKTKKVVISMRIFPDK